MMRVMRVSGALLVALTLAGCGEDTEITPTAEPQPTTTARPSTVEDAWRNAGGRENVTTRVPATLPPQNEGPLGTTFTVNPGDRKITAYTFKMPVTSSNRFTTPRDGTQFAAIEVQECAGPVGERFTPNRFDFELAMADNTRIRAGIEVAQPQLASSPLLPGDCIRGWVSYEVPTTGTVRHIVYSAGNASAKWLVT